MLQANMSEVCEPYTYEFTNSLSNMKDSITRADGINLQNTLSLHLKNYVKAQLNTPNAEDSDLVAEDEPLEAGVSTAQCTSGANSSNPLSSAVNLGKTKKDKEKALKNGDLHEILITKQDLLVTKINKKKASKKFKAKAWKEWHGDFIKEHDAE